MPPPRSRARRATRWGLVLVLPAAVLSLVFAVMLSELDHVDHDLRLIVPSAVRPGDPVPVQAFLFEGIGGVERPRLVARTMRWRRGDRSLPLAPSVAGGSAATVPALGSGPEAIVSVEATGSDGLPVRTEAVIARDDDAPPAPLEGRSAHAAQHLELGPIVDVEGQVAPRPFELRVTGGACVPEHPCSLLAHVGAPAAALRVVGNASVTPIASESTELEGLTRLDIVTHGPDSHARIEALRGGIVVGHRELRLPVALATPAVSLEDPFVGRDVSLEVQPPPGRETSIVDSFRAGRWVGTASGVAADPLSPSLPPGSGLLRLQVRTDPFASRRAAVRYVWVGDDPAQPSVEDALRAVVLEGGEASAPPGPAPLRFAWAVAPLEEGIRQLPTAVSGRPAAEARLVERQGLVRGMAFVAIALGLLAIASLFLRRGVDAALEAQRVMDETGDEELMSARHRRRTLFSALGIVALTLLAFLAAATLVVVRLRLLD